jgi:hypothetical protein
MKCQRSHAPCSEIRAASSKAVLRCYDIGEKMQKFGVTLNFSNGDLVG